MGYHPSKTCLRIKLRHKTQRIFGMPMPCGAKTEAESASEDDLGAVNER
jgi:hypothetical protein